MSGFWLPLAIEETNLYSSYDVIKSYFGAIEQLTSQILYLQQLLRVNYDVEIKPLSFVSITNENTSHSEEDFLTDEDDYSESEPEQKLDCERGDFGF